MTQDEFQKDLDTFITLTKRELNDIVTAFTATELGLINEDGSVDDEKTNELRVRTYHDLNHLLNEREERRNKYLC
jgi:hypothetical protein